MPCRGRSRDPDQLRLPPAPALKGEERQRPLRAGCGRLSRMEARRLAGRGCSRRRLLATRRLGTSETAWSHHAIAPCGYARAPAAVVLRASHSNKSGFDRAARQASSI
jgi:hypothetical protein